MKVAIIGGGAAGFFAAIAVKENYPDANVIIFEKSKKILAKVKISGGGRCNVTNGETSISELCKAYPRGGKKLKKAFHVFNTKDTMEWFQSRGVPLVIQEDNCVFPTSQNSQSIINCLVDETQRLNIKIEENVGIASIDKLDKGLQVLTSNNDEIVFDKIIIATGGSPKRKGLEWLEKLNHEIEDPVPSLFTFNMPKDPITKLMGVVVENAMVSIRGTKLKSEGPLLVTHWGMSGPAILILSAFGARILSEKQYQFSIQVNWVHEKNYDVVFQEIQSIAKENKRKKLANIRPYLIPDRLWKMLILKAELTDDRVWGELGNKSIHKITTLLTNDIYTVSGKTTFKEEFVTCGGVSLDSIDLKTMQSKVCPNLYFAGEVMDIDAITGGYNFQAAWTTGFIAGQLND